MFKVHTLEFGVNSRVCEVGKVMQIVYLIHVCMY